MACHPKRCRRIATALNHPTSRSTPALLLAAALVAVAWGAFTTPAVGALSSSTPCTSTSDLYVRRRRAPDGGRDL